MHAYRAEIILKRDPASVELTAPAAGKVPPRAPTVRKEAAALGRQARLPGGLGTARSPGFCCAFHITKQLIQIRTGKEFAIDNHGGDFSRVTDVVDGVPVQ